MTENKFQRTVNRIMTSSEARQRAVDMGLPSHLVEYLAKDFEEINKNLEEFKRDNYKWPEEELEARGVGENGRAALGQSWEYGLEGLAKVMGIDAEEDWGALEDPELMRVWDAFYEE